jgi:hypothetical protein
MTKQEQPAPAVPHRLIVVASEGMATDEIEAIVRARCGERVEVQVHLSAPASRVSWLNWTTNVEGPAGSETPRSADGIAGVNDVNVDPSAGEFNPLQAIEDALRRYAADELVIVTASDEQASWIESDLENEVRERFGLRITHLVAEPHTEI